MESKTRNTKKYMYVGTYSMEYSLTILVLLHTATTNEASRKMLRLDKGMPTYLTVQHHLSFQGYSYFWT